MNIRGIIMDLHLEVMSIHSKLTDIRRDLHKHPESAWLEYRTSAVVADELTRLDYQVYVGPEVCKPESRMGLPKPEVFRDHEQHALDNGANPVWVEKMRGGHTGVVGVLQTGLPGPIIALRFDIDSNDLNESESQEHKPVRDGFASTHLGMMHACGHDGHTAIGLGTAEILAAYKDQLVGEIRILFQPAEEGTRGAKSMVDAGWLEGVDYFFSGHIALQSRTLGEIVAATGGFLATTKLNVSFHGRSAHAGSSPQEGRNALLASAAAALHLHGISRHGGGATRINVGTLAAGSGRNSIPDRAEMKLEIRGETTELNNYMKTEALRVIVNAAEMYGVSCESVIVGEAPGAASSESLVPMIEREARQMEQIVTVVPYKDIGVSEDVVYMLNAVQTQGGQAAYMLFGSPLSDGHHQVCFDFDEQVLAIGTEMFLRLIWACQSGQSS
jgi:aminobenzoyl-glutamate utilization protein A